MPGIHCRPRALAALPLVLAACTGDPALEDTDKCTGLACAAQAVGVIVEPGVVAESGARLGPGTPFTAWPSTPPGWLDIEYDGPDGAREDRLPPDIIGIDWRPVTDRAALDVCPAGWSRVGYVRHTLDGLGAYRELAADGVLHKGVDRLGVVAEGGRYAVSGRALADGSRDAATWLAAEVGGPSGDDGVVIEPANVDAWRYLALEPRCARIGAAQVAELVPEVAQGLAYAPIRLAQVETSVPFDIYMANQGNTYRARNLTMALDRLDGLVLAPGDSVSFLDQTLCDRGLPDGAIGEFAGKGCYAGDHERCDPDDPLCHAECFGDQVCHQRADLGCQPYFDGPRAGGGFGMAGGAELAAIMLHDAQVEAGLAEPDALDHATTHATWYGGVCGDKTADLAIVNPTDRPVVIVAGARLIEHYDSRVSTYVDDVSAYLELWTAPPVLPQ